MADYADWTESIELLGSEIMVPFDVQGAYIQVPMDLQGALIQMPVDIQGQYITLDIDIVAQSVGNIAIDIAAQTIGNINVNIAASDVTMNVNIAASAVTINMDIKAQTVAVKTQGEWSPQAGQQKYATLYSTINTFGGTAYADYQVTSGKTLYITHVSFTISAQSSVNANNNQIGLLSLYNYSTSTYLAMIGGNGGAGLTFPTPLKLTSTQILRMRVQNCAYPVVEIYACWGGYEI